MAAGPPSPGMLAAAPGGGVVCLPLGWPVDPLAGAAVGLGADFFAGCLATAGHLRGGRWIPLLP